MHGDHCSLPSVIIDDSDLMGVSVLELKTDPPWPADCHRPLAFAVAGQLVQTKALERTQIGERRGRIERCKQAFGDFDVHATEAGSLSLLEEALTPLIGPRAYHTRIVLRVAYNRESILPIDGNTHEGAMQDRTCHTIRHRTFKSGIPVSAHSGSVRLSGRRADCGNEDCIHLSWLSISVRRVRPRRVALLSIRFESSRCRRPAFGAGCDSVARDDSAMVF